MTKNVLLKDDQGNFILPITTASNVSGSLTYADITNVDISDIDFTAEAVDVELINDDQPFANELLPYGNLPE